MTTLLTSTVAFGKDFKGYDIDNDEVNKKYEINLTSGKKKDVRFYKGLRTKIYQQSIDYVMKSITNFEDKCNNDYKDRRELISKKKDCSYHNGNLVESKIYRNLKEYKKGENEIDRFLVARRIYNRQEFSHVDQIRIFETKNEKGQKVITIKGEMLKDKQVKKYMKPPVEKDSVFIKAYSEFKLTEIEKNKTELTYTFTSKTDHWLLNKSVSVSKVFESMAKSIDLLFYSIKKELVKNKPSIIKSTAVAVTAP
tara:strand:+ start:202 stop:960 length:759 start_codon:yes stop_codon:yes gene_type:complete